MRTDPTGRSAQNLQARGPRFEACRAHQSPPAPHAYLAVDRPTMHVADGAVDAVDWVLDHLRAGSGVRNRAKLSSGWSLPWTDVSSLGRRP